MGNSLLYVCTPEYVSRRKEQDGEDLEETDRIEEEKKEEAQ